MTSDTILSGIFADETAPYRSPAEPEPFESVTLRIRAPRGCFSSVRLITDAAGFSIPMTLYHQDPCSDWFETRITFTDQMAHYAYYLESPCLRVIYQKNGAVLCERAPLRPDPLYAFRFYPGFHVPEWSKGAVMYQIFPDRFRNGDLKNDVVDHEYYYYQGHVRPVAFWEELPDDGNMRVFAGGDLAGILEKLDYLQDLGVDVIYLNPIFVSPSSHKYDTQDYDHIDPHLGVLLQDEDHRMQSWEKDNRYARMYITRVTNKQNLEASDELFASLCKEIHRRGMKIILDGVFNHCGSFHKWMDREGIYRNQEGYAPGAYDSVDSPYRSFFKFKEGTDSCLNYDIHGQQMSAESAASLDITFTDEYEGWWNYATLPKLNYEDSAALCEEVLRIADHWASPPYSIDGWRLDVAADLGHSEAFNHHFWQYFRKELKSRHPNLLILAEHYGDPTDYLAGREWDTVMNYDAFMEPVTFFFTGMEKHSDQQNSDACDNGPLFFENMRKGMACMTAPSLLCAMNELSNHDHSRFLTRTNGRIGRLETLGSAAAGEGIRKEIFRQAVVLQMTWPGAPTLYYGDEAGQVGWTDPDCRRTYPWGHEDAELVSLHRDLIELRHELTELRTGSLQSLYADQGTIVYARFVETPNTEVPNTEVPNTENPNAMVSNTDPIRSVPLSRVTLVAFNTLPEAKTIRVDLSPLGYLPSINWQFYFQTDRNGHRKKEELSDSKEETLSKFNLANSDSINSSFTDSCSGHMILSLTLSGNSSLILANH